MKRNVLETLMGAVVVIVAVLFIVFAYTQSQFATVKGYELYARFDRVDGLSPGSDVRIGGIKVGSVVEQILDPETFEAVVRISIDPKYKLPADSSAAVLSDGLLGGKYLSLNPGADDEVLKPGSEIRYTQSSISIDQLIGKFVFGGAGGGKKPEEPK